MYRKVLLCYDGTTEGRNALREGAEVALCMGAEAHLLAICRSGIDGSVPEGITPALIQCDDDRSQAILKEGVSWLEARGLKAHGLLVYGDPLDHIPNVAREIGADLIVVGHRQRGRLSRWWSDSDEQTLLDRTQCSILACVVRET
ncbi:MAG TPA: universal stress protein [Casimicrobiaceae bacterium]|nr:universal stress protein [Casimicrobiaceae bacterium]